MMKIVKMILCVLAALWTVGVAIGFVSKLGQHGGTRGTTELFAGIGATAICALITYWLYESAFKKSESEISPDERDS